VGVLERYRARGVKERNYYETRKSGWETMSLEKKSIRSSISEKRTRKAQGDDLVIKKADAPVEGRRQEGRKQTLRVGG